MCVCVCGVCIRIHTNIVCINCVVCDALLSLSLSLSLMHYSHSLTHSLSLSYTHPQEVLEEQTLAMREIEKAESSTLMAAKQDFKKAEQALLKKRRERDKKLKASAAGAGSASGGEEDGGVESLRNAMAAAADRYVHALDSDRKSRAKRAAQATSLLLVQMYLIY